MVADALTEPVPGSPPDRDTLAAALEHANLPTLVPVLHQLTGDRRWLADPIPPTRSRGIENTGGGGSRGDGAAEIRSAALEAVLAWSAGRPAAVPEPTGNALVELMGIAAGEPGPAGYGAMMAGDMGFGPAEPVPAVPGTDLRVVVIGAGVSGMLAAIRLHEAGIAHV